MAVDEGATSNAAGLGLVATTAIGVGAIVGGGIFVLAGGMVASAGPASLVALALNGVVALLTAMSFAELATANPENGGEYAFARRVLSVRSAFAVGWVVLFAYAVAAALYAIGFASQAGLAVGALTGWTGAGTGATGSALSIALVVALTAALARWGPVGGVAANVGKVLVFGGLIAGGLAIFLPAPIASSGSLLPFAPGGLGGIVAAMGMSFILLQGFGNIAAVAGQVHAPERTIPRAMFVAIAIALAIYAPLLLLIQTVGIPEGDDLVVRARSDAEGFFAFAVETWMGRFGWWLVTVAAMLAMASALQANLIAAAGVAQAMASDRTLPRALAVSHAAWKTPATALLVIAALVAAVVVLLPDPSTAGAAASLIFLLCFALVHGLAWTLRRRRPANAPGYRSPAFPAVPLVGGLACAGVALYQMAIVPMAGWLTLVWLGFGLFFYMGFLAARAEAMDAASQSIDVALRQSRGKREVVLVPVASPRTAPSLASLAGMLVPPGTGRVVVLRVAIAEPGAAEETVREALSASHAAVDAAATRVFTEGHAVDVQLTVAAEPWSSIRRIAEAQSAGSVLLGLPPRGDTLRSDALNGLLRGLQCDVALLCGTQEFAPARCRRVLVPIGGSNDHDAMRARVLGALLRSGAEHFTFVRVLAPDAPAEQEARARHRLRRLIDDEVRGRGELAIVRSADAAEALLGASVDHDLLVLGATRSLRGTWALSELLLRTAAESSCPSLILSRRSDG